MTTDVVLAGLGQLGRRHLEGLSKSTNPLSIWIKDPNQAALQAAIEAWETAGGHKGPHTLHVDALPNKNAEFGIVSTTAPHRIAAIRDILKTTLVGTWIVEKPLSQCLTDLDEISALVGVDSYVNLARRMMTWHTEIAQIIRSEHSPPMAIDIKGGAWRMASNMLHQIDLVRRWTDEWPIEMDLSGLCDNWLPSKRSGFYEVYGDICIKFSGGSSLNLSCKADQYPLTHDIKSVEGISRLREYDGVFYPLSGSERRGKIEYQSQMTGRVIDNLINTGTCPLPTVRDVTKIERIILQNLIPHHSKQFEVKHILRVT